MYFVTFGVPYDREGMQFHTNPVSDFLSDVHFLNLVDFLNVRLVHCACANNTCQA